jgi:DNA-binding transcriptional ArsR family regulator
MLAVAYSDHCKRCSHNHDNMQTRRDIFQAISDPTRRDIITMLARKPRNLNDLAGQFETTRQAISLHVKILIECGVVVIDQQGRERYCNLQPRKLAEVDKWIEPFRTSWELKFNRLDNLLAKKIRQRRNAN